MSQTTIGANQLPGIEQVKQQETLDQMELIVRKSLALHLKSLNIDFTTTAIDEIYHLFNMYMNSTLADLSRIVQVQRRFKASPRDVKILFKEHDVSSNELDKEMMRSQLIPKDLAAKRVELYETAKSLKESSENDEELEEPRVDPSDPSYVFFAHNQNLSKLIPSSHKRGKIIPSWLPQFPPDHTYLRTPNYTNRITDQKVVRTKIAEESRFGEKALDHLISFETKNENNVIEVDDMKNTGSNKIVENVEIKLTKEENTILWTPGLEKRLDIPKYAHIRAKYVERKRQQKLEEKAELDHSYYQIINELSSYTTSEKYDSELKITSQDYLENQFNVAFQSLSSLQKQKSEREIERVKLQKEENIRLAIFKAEQKQKQKEQELQKQNEKEQYSNSNIDKEAKLFNNFENFDSIENFENFGSPDENEIISFNTNEAGMIDEDEADDDIDKLEVFNVNNTESSRIASGENNNKDSSDVQMITFEQFETMEDDDDDEDMFEDIQDEGQPDSNVDISVQYSEFDTAIENESMMPHSDA